MISSVGLLYVGAVLLINGLTMLRVVPSRSAAPLNLMVGTLECVIATTMLIQANGDDKVIMAASGLYLFAFTYLYVGIGNLASIEPQGLGWFSLFVSVAAVVYALLSFELSNDAVFGVIWMSWAVLWFLFFLVLGLNRQHLTAFTGWITILFSFSTCTIPAFLILTGSYRSSAGIAIVVGIILFLLSVTAKIVSSRWTLKTTMKLS